jgi:nucleotide-binding universal stress UspA family protein
MTNEGQKKEVLMQALQTATKIAFKNILFLTDFSEASEPALAYAVGLARHYNANLFPAHAAEPIILTEASDASVVDEIIENSRKRLDTLVKTTDVKVNPLFSRGDIETVFPRWIEENGIDLVVIGTHARHGISRLLMGSTAEFIFRHAPCPVLTVGPHVAFRPFHGFMAEKVLFPTDLGPHAEFASTYALSFVKETNGEVIFMHIVTLDETFQVDRTGMVDKAKDKLAALIPTDASEWSKPEMIVEIGDPATEILGYAEKERPDLIVLGLPRNKKFSTHFASGVTYKVVAGAPCPVLTIRDMIVD